MTDRGLIPIRFYAEFIKRDWPALPQSAQESLASFLLKLQNEPNSPQILAKTERDRVGRLGYEFSPDYVVYWQVVSETDLPERIEVLAVLKNEITLSETMKQSTLGADASTVQQQDSLEKVYSRNARLDNLAMWGNLHVSRHSAKLAGWIVDSWSDHGAPYLRPKLHWVSLPDHRLHRVQLNIDFRSTMSVGPEDTEVEPERLIFIRATLGQWEQDWREHESNKTP